MSCQCKAAQRGYEFLGFGWERMKTREGFNRYLIRRCLDCHALMIERINWVRENVPFCTVCFTQNLMQVAQDDGQLTSVCKTCGARTEFHMMAESHDRQ